MCPNPETLLRLLDGDLPADQERALRSHLAGCDACRDSFGELQSTWRLLERWNATPPVSPSLTASIVRLATKERTRGALPWRAAALSVAASIAVGYVAALAIPTNDRPAVASPDAVVESLGLDNLSDNSSGLAGVFDLSTEENPS